MNRERVHAIRMDVGQKPRFIETLDGLANETRYADEVQQVLHKELSAHRLNKFGITKANLMKHIADTQ